MSNLKDVIMPDGEPFDETDWNVYSNEYTKKPVTIRAIKLECPVIIKTLEGVMVGNTGDYLIRGLEGEFYPCKPDIFLKTYEKVKVKR